MWRDKGLREMQEFEGRRVSVALTDGSRIDDCQLVSVGRRGTTTTVWLYGGADVFVQMTDVIDIWECYPSGCRAA